MKRNNVEEFLNKKAKSLAPKLMADPFLATRIESIVNTRQNKNLATRMISNWSFASAITALAIVIGVYLGAGISDSDNLQYSDDYLTEYSEAFYQSGVIENWDNAMENGGTVNENKSN